ncbi:GDP-mannose 4,6-dehydratase [Pseudomonas piscis]|uniref:GDP-mannose 4,6-dehydratase n=1 Tax=Pseudomonas piscis TaxID=2614538 RepID=UPI0003B4727A|nr:GDP-mannose 4,6-dehydratase [Pseudomonas piscis]ERO63477.1 GDP-6-deoxy-D-lyxo-4-hexulose reductase [Pseudomonas piscis]
MDSPSDKQRALITGLEGFTGHYVAEELRRRGYEIFGTRHSGEEQAAGCFRVDICDLAALRRVVEEVEPEVVVHLAAISFVAHGEADAIYRANVVGTRNLLEALAGLTRTPRAVLLASSANVYGNAPVELIGETVTLAPANDYAVSKLAMEYMARLWLDRLPIVITRPFNYTGVGQAPHFLIPKIVSHFQQRAPVIELGNLDVERDFSDVRVVAQAYARLLEVVPAGQVVNVGSGQVVSLREVLAMMSKISGHEIEVRVNPSYVRANEVKRLQGDVSKLKGLVGDYQPIPLLKTLEWMFRNGPE